MSEEGARQWHARIKAGLDVITPATGRPACPVCTHPYRVGPPPRACLVTCCVVTLMAVWTCLTLWMLFVVPTPLFIVPFTALCTLTGRLRSTGAAVVLPAAVQHRHIVTA